MSKYYSPRDWEAMGPPSNRWYRRIDPWEKKLKRDKKNTLDSQALDELINQRDSLWQQIQAGNNSSGLYLQFKALDNEIQKSLNKDQGKLQNMKK